MEKINLVVSQNLMHIRKEQQLSLEKLASISGVSRAMLNQIEKGQSNPTISTLWKISNGLKVPLSKLLHESENTVHVIKKNDIQTIYSEDGLIQITPYYDSEEQIEILKMTLQPHSEIISSDQAAHSEEYIIVNEGLFTIIVDGASYSLEKNDSIRFSGGLDHTYQNTSEKPAEITLVIKYHFS